jgi:hypothetical protein
MPLLKSYPRIEFGVNLEFKLMMAGSHGGEDLRIVLEFHSSFHCGSLKMPLVLMCGFPGSGKSIRALELFEHLKGLGKEVQIVNEESLNINRAEGYKGTFETLLAPYFWIDQIS